MMVDQAAVKAGFVFRR